MADHIFISYARADGQSHARRLHDDLEANGIEAWLDVFDIPQGGDWDAEIDNALRTARGKVVVLTPGAVLSFQVKSEWNDALNRNLPVIPLLFQDCEIPRLLSVLNYIDMRPDYVQGRDQLLERLRHLDRDHLDYLLTLEAAFEVAQQDAEDPRRFQPKIASLQATIADWGKRTNRQQERITRELEAQRQRMQEAARQRQNELPLHVVGQRLIDASSHFWDREDQQNRLSMLLAEPDTRMVSIIGRGGMGKTALVSKVIGSLEHNVWLHESGGPNIKGIIYFSTQTKGISLERIFLDCAQMLGGEPHQTLRDLWGQPQLPIADKISHLLDELHNGPYILLLDNIEDLLDSTGQLVDADLQTFFDQALTNPHNARFVLTTRVPLKFSRTMMHANHQIYLDEGLPEADAITMLRNLDPNGIYEIRSATTEQLQRAAEITRGVPRALEIIVGIMANDAFVTLNEILSQFYERDDVMEELVRDAYKRLDNDSRRVMQALAVFKRAVPQVAVDFLLAPFAPGLEVPSILRNLAVTHLVNIDRQNKTISLHPIDQEYAYHTLPETGDYNRAALEDRAAEYYVQMRTDPDTWQSIDDVEPQMLEFEHRIRAEAYDAAATMLDEITLKLYTWGQARRVLTMRHQLQGNLTDPALQVSNYHYLGSANLHLSQVDAAAEVLQTGLELAQSTGNREFEVRIGANLGLVYMSVGRFPEAQASLLQAHAAAEEVDNKVVMSHTLHNLGLACFNQGQYEQAVEYYQQALKVSEVVGDKSLISSNLLNMGNAHYVLLHYDEAMECFDRALEMAQEIGYRVVEVALLSNLGALRYDIGEMETAIEYSEQAIAITHQTENVRERAMILSNLGIMYTNLGDHEQAEAQLQEAFKTAEAIGDRASIVLARGYAGKLHSELEDFDLAQEHLEAAVDLAVEIKSLEQNELGGYLAEVYLFTGQYERGLTTAELACQHNDPRHGMYTTAIYGLLLVMTEQYDAALAILDAARQQADLALEKTPRMYRARYVRALALAGIGILSNSEDLAEAETAYQTAYEICPAPGVRREALRLLRVLQSQDSAGWLDAIANHLAH